LSDVGEALRITRAPGVDVSSGVERAPGHHTGGELERVGGEAVAREAGSTAPAPEANDRPLANDSPQANDSPEANDSPLAIPDFVSRGYRLTAASSSTEPGGLIQAPLRRLRPWTVPGRGVEVSGIALRRTRSVPPHSTARPRTPR